MNYVETFCDDLAILHGGEIVLHGNIREIKRRYPRNRISISLSDGNGSQAWPVERVHDWLADLTRKTGPLQMMIAAIEQDEDRCRIVLHQADQRDQLLQELVRVRAPLEQFNIVEPTLEDIFIEKTGDSQDSKANGLGGQS